jgi:protein-tyrosine phosphatase
MSNPSEKPITVLMICMGNICRSPLAEGTFQHLLEQAHLTNKITVDSAGTHFYHSGCSADVRSIAVAKTYGLDISHQRARQLCPQDFYDFDYLCVMDNRNLRDAASLAPTPELAKKLTLFLDYSQEAWSETEVPDPYTGGDEGFEHVYQLVLSASKGLLKTIQATHGV